MSGLYVYGICDAASLTDAAYLGPGLAAAEILRCESAGLAAIVSAWEGDPPEATRRHMLTHTKLLERAIAEADLLPVRFGTIAPDAARLTTCMQRNAAAFRAALEDIAGRIELGVKASWAEGIAYQEILAEDNALRGLRDRLQSLPPAQTYQERIELGRRVETALERKRTAETARILATLDPIAERSLPLGLVEETMVLNRAFLVRREAETHFDDAMQHLGSAAGERLGFRYVGPVPPYNFVTLRADWLGEAA